MTAALLFAAIALVPHAPGSTPVHQPRAPELHWIPAAVDLVVVLERPPEADKELFRSFVLEIAFALRLDSALEEAGKVARLELASARRFVLAAQTDPRTILALVTWDSPARPPEAVPPRANSRLTVAKGFDVIQEPGKTEVAVAQLEESQILLGTPALVEHALQLKQNRRQDSIARNPISSRLGELETTAWIWGVLGPRWFNPEPAKDSTHFSGSFTRSRSRILSACFQAEISSEIRFEMQTQAADDRSAFVLADELRAFLRSARSGAGGPADVKEVLEAARVERSSTNIKLLFPIKTAAMRLIKNNAISRKLLCWKLDAGDRELWQDVRQILDLLEVKPGSRVADIGAGEGFYTSRLAHAVGEDGRVYAAEISLEALADLRARASAAPFPNVEIVHGDPDNPNLPASALDAALIVNAYHEMPQHQPMLKHIYSALRPRGRLMLIEPYLVERRADTREKQEKDHNLAPEIIEEDLRQAGYEVSIRVDEFTPPTDARTVYSLIVARRPQ